MTQSPLDEYRELTYDRTIKKLKQEQQLKQTLLQKLLTTKSVSQFTKV